ncbi:hypothetical protein JCM9803A_00750 [Rhodococcus erythropolis]
MTHCIPIRIKIVWWGLVIATCISLGVSKSSSASTPDHRYAAAAVLAIAFLKARYIAMDFMEARHAQPVLRWTLEVWFLLFGSLSVALVVI